MNYVILFKNGEYYFTIVYNRLLRRQNKPNISHYSHTSLLKLKSVPYKNTNLCMHNINEALASFLDDDNDEQQANEEESNHLFSIFFVYMSVCTYKTKKRKEEFCICVFASK